MAPPAAPGIVSRVIEFCHALRNEGLVVTPRAAVDAVRSIENIAIADPVAFRAALRANLVSSVDEMDTFDRLYGRYFGTGDEAAANGQRHDDPYEPLAQRERPDEAVFMPLAMDVEGFDPEGDARLPGGDRSAGDADLVTRKDFGEYSDLDALRARRLMRRLVPALATAKSRRVEPAPRGAVDFRRTVQALRRLGGDAVGLAWRRNRTHRLRLVALCDVSGSMDVYSRYLLQFLYAIQNEQGGVRTFVFSTRLEDVSGALRRKRFSEALAAVQERVEAWSGGTSIGRCIETFNCDYAAELVGPRTVVLIVSDGWERGDPALLAREMRALRRRARTIIWLNPLKGHDGYQPLARGMAAALPHVDEFLAANSLESLERLGRSLSRA